jgi:hypothetical protein
VRLIKYNDRENAKQIIKQYQCTFPEKITDELNKISVEIQKEDLDYKSVYGVLDKVVKPRTHHKVYDFIQGTLNRIQPVYECVIHTPESCLGEFAFFDTYLNNDEFRGQPTGYYKIDDLILMEGGY